MRRKEKEIKEKEIINEILNNSQICRIAILDDDYPYIVPMNYGYDNNSIYFHCATNGRKIDLLRLNNKVGFEIEQSHEVVKNELSCKWTTNYRSIIGYGKIVIINDFEQKKKGLDIIMRQHGKTENLYNDNAIKNVLILKLNIKDLTAKQSGEYSNE